MSSKRAIRRREERFKNKSCSGKQKHPDKISALIVLKKLKRTNLKIYKCGFCGSFHTGHSATIG